MQVHFGITISSDVVVLDGFGWQTIVLFWLAQKCVIVFSAIWNWKFYFGLPFTGQFQQILSFPTHIFFSDNFFFLKVSRWWSLWLPLHNQHNKLLFVRFVLLKLLLLIWMKVMFAIGLNKCHFSESINDVVSIVQSLECS